ncbi:hypothetical protein [Shinella sp.]|uniref:hypothetical protein n=1 Tax=Shinella sp. TaxID=1870904 RepID=UPI003F6FC8B1
MENSIRQLYRDQKKILDLIRQDSPGSGFESAVRRLFGDKCKGGKTIRIGNREFKYSKLAKNLLSFLPARWHEELDKAKHAWPGCENWWAGYPLIAMVEMRVNDDGIAGFLKLNAEVGPISDHKVRKGIIEAIQTAATEEGLERIQFPTGASDKGRLYSRFLRENSIALSDIRDVNDVEKKFTELVTGFEPEFELVASVVPLLVR